MKVTYEDKHNLGVEEFAPDEVDIIFYALCKYQPTSTKQYYVGRIIEKIGRMRTV